MPLSHRDEFRRFKKNCQRQHFSKTPNLQIHPIILKATKENTIKKMAIKLGFQEKHPNILIWILFGSSFTLFVVGAILYGLGTKKLWAEEDPMFIYWPLIDSMFRILPHVVVCIIYRLCRFSSNKSVALALHVIIAVFAFIGTVFANEHEIYKGGVTNVTALMQKAIIHKIVPKDPLIWIFSSWLEFFYVIMMIYKCP